MTDASWGYLAHINYVRQCADEARIKVEEDRRIRVDKAENNQVFTKRKIQKEPNERFKTVDYMETCS